MIEKILKILLAALFIIGVTDLSAQNNFKPEVHGILKVKSETDTYNGTHRFNVRNSRIGVRGYAVHGFKYGILVEVNSEGSFDILDSYIGYEWGAFDFTLGKQGYVFNTELNRGAGRNYFANRSFMGKFITGYYQQGASAAIGGIGSRDTGFLARWTNRDGFPLQAAVGVFNGNGGMPEWQNFVNGVFHLTTIETTGFGGAVSYYIGKTGFGDKMQMWSAEARYRTGRLILEGEFAQRFLGFETGGTDVMSIAVLNVLYKFPLAGNKFMDHIAPVARWDYGDNIVFRNVDGRADNFGGHRITCGITIGLTEKLLKSEIRFNYEHFMLKNRPVDYGVNPLLHNKFTIELLASF